MTSFIDRLVQDKDSGHLVPVVVLHAEERQHFVCSAGWCFVETTNGIVDRVIFLDDIETFRLIETVETMCERGDVYFAKSGGSLAANPRLVTSDDTELMAIIAKHVK